ncbi:putative metal-nicotianamine transporter ysl7, variant 2 [Trifolium repens]|nr:putative metal-nicotianamine transporter ysl7, variant 2 [Trifolium repens]
MANNDVTVMMSNDEQESEEEASIEKGFEGVSVLAWQKQITVRAIIVSFLLSVLFTFIVMKLNLTTGIIPSLNTCVVAASGIAFSGGFGSYLFAMSPTVAKQSGGNMMMDVKIPGLGWMIAFLFVVRFLGIFSVVPLRKIMIVDFGLTYPSGTATATLINSFHTTEGAKLAKKQVQTLGKFFSFSFLWGFFQWFFTSGDSCGFASFPTFGLEAYQRMFYFDFSATYVGVGMICPYIINISLLIGGILSWGVMWPLIEDKKGDWYPSDLKQSFVKVLGRTLYGLYNQFIISKTQRSISPSHDALPSTLSFDDKRRTEMFLKDQIPSWFAISGYGIIAIISTVTIPYIFHQLKWYHILCIYIIGPALAFCNAYGCGLTDWSLASTYGKLAIFIICAWAGSANGGVIAGLAACGVMMNIVSTASDLMQDFKTGYMTLASPKSMFVSQVIGTAMGCIISPCVFWLFYHAFGTLGQPGSAYPAPFALVYRNIAILSVDGVSALPKNCLLLCCVFFAGAIIINLVRDLSGEKYGKFIPVPMAMAIPFYIGSYFAIDMCVGSLILFVWKKVDKAKADAFGSAVASGLICGDGIWSLPSSFLALAGVQPPICMKFLSGTANAKVDAFLGS